MLSCTTALPDEVVLTFSHLEWDSGTLGSRELLRLGTTRRRQMLLSKSPRVLRVVLPEYKQLTTPSPVNPDPRNIKHPSAVRGSESFAFLSTSATNLWRLPASWPGTPAWPASALLQALYEQGHSMLLTWKWNPGMSRTHNMLNRIGMPRWSQAGSHGSLAWVTRESMICYLLPPPCRGIFGLLPASGTSSNLSRLKTTSECRPGEQGTILQITCPGNVI